MQTHTTHDALLAAFDTLARAPGRGGWAASDADGTLWAADVADEAYQLLIAERLMRPPAAPVMRRLVESAGEVASGDPHLDARRLYDLYLAGRVDDWAMLEAMTACYAGWTEEEVRAFGRRVFEELVAEQVYATTAPVLQGLRDRGLSLVVVSGSPAVLVEEAIHALGFHVPVCGVQIEMRGGRWGDRLAPPVTWERGKVDALAPLGASAPVVSFGDTLGDLALLQAATGLRVLVHPRPSLRLAAQAHVEPPERAADWCVLAPPTTVSGAAVTPPLSDKTIV